MKQSSLEEPVGNETFEVYRGSVVELFKKLHISFTYYSRIFRALEGNGCITQLQKGARGVDSIYVLHYPPMGEDWDEESSTRPLTRHSEFDTLTQRVENLEKRLGGLDIVNALADIQSQVDTLSKSIPETKRKGGKV